MARARGGSRAWAALPAGNLPCWCDCYALPLALALSLPRGVASSFELLVVSRLVDVVACVARTVHRALPRPLVQACRGVRDRRLDRRSVELGWILL